VQIQMSDQQQISPADGDVPAFYVSSFNLSATSNEVVLIGNELYPTWGLAARPRRNCVRVWSCA
jgi:hypothetical protein